MEDEIQKAVVLWFQETYPSTDNRALWLSPKWADQHGFAFKAHRLYNPKDTENSEQPDIRISSYYHGPTSRNALSEFYLNEESTKVHFQRQDIIYRTKQFPINYDDPNYFDRIIKHIELEHESLKPEQTEKNPS